MKSLNLGHPLVIMTLGVPGSGKSFFARQFAETFHVPLVSFDAIRAQLFQRPTYDARQEAVVARIASLQIDQLLLTGANFVIDGGMSTVAARARVRTAAKKHHYESMVIWPQLDHNDAFYRLEHPNDKRPEDRPSPAPSREQFDQLVAKFHQPLAHGEPYIVISGKHTFATQAKVVLKKLTSNLERPAPVRETPPVERNLSLTGGRAPADTPQTRATPRSAPIRIQG